MRPGGTPWSLDILSMLFRSNRAQGFSPGRSPNIPEPGMQSRETVRNRGLRTVAPPGQLTGLYALFVPISEYIVSAMPVYSQIPLLTVDDYRALPETGPRYQLIEGDLYMAPAPNRFHQDISRNLQFELHTYLKTNPIGKLYDAPLDVYLRPAQRVSARFDYRPQRACRYLNGSRSRGCTRLCRGNFVAEDAVARPRE